MNFRNVLGFGVLMLALGCSKGPKDTSRVIANVDGEKVTEQAFRATLRALAPDEAKVKEIMEGEAQRGQRNGFLDRLSVGKAIVKFGQQQGLDKDPGVQAQLEMMKAQAYLQALMDRRAAKLEPTEKDLKDMYDEVAAAQKATGQALPPFEQVKAQLPQAWKQRQTQKMQEALLAEVRQKVPITIVDEYKGGVQF